MSKAVSKKVTKGFTFVPVLLQKIGDLRLDFNKFVVGINDSLATSYARIKEDFLFLEKRTTTELEGLEKIVTGLRAEVDRAWELAESRNALYRKVSDDTNRGLDDLTRVLQSFNERLSKLEGKVDTSVVDRNQIGMLSECIAAHTYRIQDVEEAAKIGNAAWHQMVGVEKRVTSLEAHETQPSAVDQWIVDSKLSGVYSKIADLERRLRAAEEKTSGVRVAVGSKFNPACTIPGSVESNRV